MLLSGRRGNAVHYYLEEREESVYSLLAVASKNAPCFAQEEKLIHVA